MKKQIISKLKETQARITDPAERAVMHHFVKCYQQGTWITQLDIAKSERWIGCHPKHEVNIYNGKTDTTTRMIRQVIRDLRIKYNMPILSSVKGYKLVETRQEASEYLERIEREVKARNKSSFETYTAMKNALGVSNSFLDRIF